MSNPIEIEIKHFFIEHINIDIKNIVENGVIINNKPFLEELVVLFLKTVHNGKILGLETNKPSQKTVEEIINLMPMALVELDPVDFEGDDALTIEELSETTAIYLYENISLNQIKGISLK